MSGSFTPEQALAQLLDGTGLTYRFVGAGRVSVERPAAIERQVAQLNEAGEPSPVTTPEEQMPLANDVIQLGPITVLGTRGIDVPLSNVPSSITVVDREEIQQDQITAPRIEEILRREVPGFNPTNNGVRQIRGRTAQIFINGVPVNEQLRASSGSDLNLVTPDQLSRIEVARGANSAYGFGSPGGIIALTTPRAQSKVLTLDTQLRSSFNPQQPGGSYRSSLYQSASQIVGKFDYHVGGVVSYDGLEFDPGGRRSLGFDSPSQLTNSKELLTNADGSFGYDLGDAGQLRFSGTYGYTNILEGYEIDGLGVFRVRPSSIVRLPPADNAFRRAYTANLTYLNQDVWGSAVKMELLSSDIFTKAFRSSDNETLRDEQTNQYQGFRSSVTTPLSVIYEGLSTNWGFDFMRNRYFRPVFFERTGDLESFVSPDTSLVSYAPFGQLVSRFGNLRLSAGIRREEYRGHVETANIPGGIQGGDIKPFSLNLFNAGAVYSLKDPFPLAGDIDLYASFSQGAEISQIGRAARNARTAAQIDPQPAKSNQYEIGIRRFGAALDYSMAAFYTESDLMSSLQLNPDDPLGPLIPLREPRQIWGIEGKLDWRIDEQWRLGGVLTWQDGIRKTESGDTRRIGSRDVPPVLFSGHIGYAPYPWWRNRFIVDFRGERDPFHTSAGFEEGPVDTVVLLHLAASFDVGPGELQFGIRNLLNEKYFSIPALAGNSGFLYVPEEGMRISAAYRIRW